MLDRSGWIAVLAAFALACGSFTYSLVVGAHERNAVCHVATRIAAIQLETVEESKPRTEQFERESKDRFGLSQGRFDQLLEETREKEIKRAVNLGQIVRESC